MELLDTVFLYGTEAEAALTAANDIKKRRCLNGTD